MSIKWIFNIKETLTDEVERFKIKLVAKEFS